MSELRQIRLALKLNQEDMGPLLGVKQPAYARWEAEPDKPAARAALEKAKEIYRERKGIEWLPAKEVPPGTIGGSGWSQLPEQRQSEAVQRAIDKAQGRSSPTNSHLWAARRIVADGLRARGLFQETPPEKVEEMAEVIAWGLAMEGSEASLERGLRLVLDGYEAEARRQEK